MIDLKPFYQSYTRAAHLRWLKGDLDGAIELMRTAVKAASPRDPRVGRLGATRGSRLYELQRGRLADAERMADASLQYEPDYAAALLARGRIQLAQKKPSKRSRRSARGASQSAARIPMDARRRAARC